MEPVYLSIQPAETGKQIKRLLLENGYTIREIQGAFGDRFKFCVNSKN